MLDGSGLCASVTIINNAVESCNYMSKSAAAVMILGDGDNSIERNSNITIDGLVIYGASASSLHIGASQGV